MHSAKRDALIAQHKRYKRSSKHERKIATLVANASEPTGTEARKALKRMMTQRYYKQVIQSADYSYKSSMK